MKFVLLFGPQASGKMTVGHELEKLTALKLFHNHMTIDLVLPFFPFGSPSFNRLVKLFRREMFEEVAASDLYGMIFTYVWAFDHEGDWKFIEGICEIFRSRGADICFVELETDVEERLQRNKTPHRLAHKPTKRNLEHSEQNLLEDMQKYRLNSLPGEVQEKNYIRIDNTNLTAAETAALIQKTFQL
ncbi:AAA family ATPase [Ectobacillus ponti]|uniref:AAA family ATPase n=1 Tax=Ectobacillus ponti TaxID=2961894 RepID=A0AA42BRT8_9BACI|nr:AAA family ATPase [Ectobacillus ponti]MCP8967693.1 AAA family ATPase [Ectobacillus ponti]